MAISYACMQLDKALIGNLGTSILWLNKSLLLGQHVAKYIPYKLNLHTVIYRCIIRIYMSKVTLIYIDRYMGHRK